jgi:hypothetical protein
VGVARFIATDIIILSALKSIGTPAGYINSPPALPAVVDIRFSAANAPVVFPGSIVA